MGSASYWKEVSEADAKRAEEEKVKEGWGQGWSLWAMLRILVFTSSVMESHSMVISMAAGQQEHDQIFILHTSIWRGQGVDHG